MRSNSDGYCNSSQSPPLLPPLVTPHLNSIRDRRRVNLPPLSRIEQNALLFNEDRGGVVGHRVQSDKLVNHMRASPPKSDRGDDPRRSSGAGGYPRRARFVTADKDSLSHSQSLSMEGDSGGNQSQEHEGGEYGPPIVQEVGQPLPREMLTIHHRRGMDEAANGGVEHVLLGDDHIGTSQQYDIDDIEAKLPPEKSSLKSSLKVEDTILRLNIGGASYRIRTRSILKFGPSTLLGRFCRMDHEHRRVWADAFFDDSQEYFFERVPRYFDPIYDFYAAGKLHVPKDLCFEKFMGELRFWAVSKAKMDDCCSPFAQYCLMRKLPTDSPEKDHFIGLRCAKLRRRLWLILEGHSHSKWWKLFEVTSTSFVVLSITALILGSIPEFQVPTQQKTPSSSSGSSYTTYPKAEGYTVLTQTVVKDGDEAKPEMVEHPVFNYVENMCVIYFTFEYMLRFWVAPRKFIFAKEFLNVIDLLAIVPWLFEVILMVIHQASSSIRFAIGIREENVRKVRWAFLTVRLLRVLRVVRIAKLGRFSPGLANFALTLRKSKKQMQMVAIVLLTVIIFFSTLVYFLERDEPGTTFTSIPAAFWWCLFSQTKYVPQTAAGKVVGGGAIVCGVLVLALPIAILVNNFMQVVKLREEKIIKQYAQQHGDHV